MQRRTAPTYSIKEILERLPELDTNELLVLKSLLDEEAGRYRSDELVLLHRYILAFLKIQAQKEQVALLVRIAGNVDGIWRSLKKLLRKE